jgi:HD superfamily phosphohydrolase
MILPGDYDRSGPPLVFFSFKNDIVDRRTVSYAAHSVFSCDGGVGTLSERHQIRDPVHNFVELREKEIKLVGTPLFQRLRGIRQLAMANLVYPGALHTRFDHSPGVCHVAGLLSKQLGLNDNAETDLVRLAALLHDLGHGPFSHVSESLLERYADRSKLAADQKKAAGMSTLMKLSCMSSTSSP